MGFFDAGLREGNRFFARLAAQAAKALEGIDYLERALDRSGKDDCVPELRGLAAESAELRRLMLDELHKTFVTPIDREDLFNLTHCYDDMLKYALTTLEEMGLLGVVPDAPIREMVRLLREQAEELRFAALRLAQNPRVAEQHAASVHAKEREVERVYRDAIRELFARATDPARMPEVLYRREVYRHISNMSDRADAAARTLGMVIMKLA